MLNFAQLISSQNFKNLISVFKFIAQFFASFKEVHYMTTQNPEASYTRRKDTKREKDLRQVLITTKWNHIRSVSLLPTRDLLVTVNRGMRDFSYPIQPLKESLSF